MESTCQVHPGCRRGGRRSRFRHRAVGAAGSRGGGPPQRAAVAAGRGADRPDRLLGVGRQRGLALADGHAAQGRFRQRAAQPRRARKVANCVGSRRPTARAWPTAPPALMRDPDAAAHHLGERAHAEDRNRCRRADAASACSTRAAAAGAALAAGPFGRRMGASRRRGGRGAPARRLAGGNLKVDDHDHERRVAAQERRALQRERDADRVLRSLRRAERRRVAGR